MAEKRNPRPCWYDLGQALMLLLGLAEGIMELIKSITGS